MSTLRVGFAGTPAFAVPCLQALFAADYSVVAVFTQPDRPAGRGRKLQASPVKVLAQQAGIAVFQPEQLRSAEQQQLLIDQQLDVLIVVAYGLILPPVVLQAPRLGCLNVHASLLPRWRGAAPIQRAIEAGDEQTGVAIMQMAKGLDTGAVFAEARCAIDSNTTATALHDTLAELGAKTLVESLPAIIEGRLSAKPQATEGVTYAHKLSKAEAMIDWHSDAETICRRIRAFDGFPVAQTRWQGQSLRLWRAYPSALSLAAEAPAGTVLSQSAEGLRVAAGRGVVVITELQLPGKRRVSVADFSNSHDLQGQQFD